MNLTKGKIEKDKVLSEGFRYRRYSWAMFQFSVVMMLLLMFQNFWLDLVILAINLVGYSFVWRFKLWEVRNEAYLRGLGFDAK